MLLGPLRPLSPDVQLAELLGGLRCLHRIGAWVFGSRSVQCAYRVQGAPTIVILSSDLGFLLTRCSRILLRQGGQSAVLEAETVIHWRALQVATGTPWLPGYEQLVSMFPGIERTAQGFLVPLQTRSPEEFLAHCLENGLQITGSEVVYTCPASSG